ncbi:ribonuclease H [Microbacterium sp. 77mftsu3.1]|uniref:ribonuclease H family protein n=1 Tax=Microbacterium sp. 77mftsu3.1 TaxID=1761802 RepID=UPI00038266A1|nr:ribonuclease H [Microbacterium sp. 77mftsu3.1]SDH35764.1 ribonuclease HI [Microbacterium sp. 77mftsu3.1]
MAMTVATDGACKRNPGPAGWAWVNDEGAWASGSLRAGTNNIGELLALLNAIDEFQYVGDLQIKVDSQYVIDSYSKWMDGWAKRGWTTAAGAPVANVDIMKQLLEARNWRRTHGLPDVILVKVKGHSGDILNGWADILAVQASERGAAGIEDVRGTEEGEPAADITRLPEGATVRPATPKRRYRRR